MTTMPLPSFFLQIPDKIKYEPEAKAAKAGTFVVYQEDHTLGNLLRCQMEQGDPDVVFAGYRETHLKPEIQIQVKTKEGMPAEALHRAAGSAIAEVLVLRASLQIGLAKLRPKKAQK